MTNLSDLLPRDPSPDALLDVFTGWVESSGISLYPHQEESLLAVLAGDNAIVTTPTTQYPPSTKALREATAKSGVPMNRILRFCLSISISFCE